MTRKHTLITIITMASLSTLCSFNVMATDNADNLKAAAEDAIKQVINGATTNKPATKPEVKIITSPKTEIKAPVHAEKPNMPNKEIFPPSTQPAQTTNKMPAPQPNPQHSNRRPPMMGNMQGMPPMMGNPAMGNQRGNRPMMMPPQGMPSNMPPMQYGRMPNMPMMGGNPMYSQPMPQGRMPMMQMRQQKHAMKAAHMKKMETSLANIEALLKQLVELQKSSK